MIFPRPTSRERKAEFRCLTERVAGEFVSFADELAPNRVRPDCQTGRSRPDAPSQDRWARVDSWLRESA